MTKPWRLSGEAERELAAAARWYEEQRSGLGDELVDVVSDAISALSRSPGSATLVKDVASKGVVRRRRIDRFPYAVVFVEYADEVLVLAIAHLRQRPNYWARRLRAK